MALQVWLPLTKDIRNQGLANVTVTNNGATFNSAGKLGGCYNCDGEISIPYNFNTTNNNYSISFWYYYPSSTGRYMPINTNSSGNFCIYFRDSQVCLNTNNNGNNNCFNYTVPINIWNHYCIVVNNNTWKLYVNGIDYGNSTTTLSISFTNFTIGSSRGYGGKINDVRIYDNCLSEREIKKLSQGLVLHYPLNRQGFGQENLFKNSSLTDLTSDNLSSKIYYQRSYIPEITSNGIKFTWTDSSAREIDLWLDTNLKADTYYTLSFVYRNNMAIGSSFYLRNNGSLVGYWSQPTIPYSENWAKYSCTFKIANYQTNDATTGTLLTLFYSGYTANKWIELKQNSIKLEEGSLVTPWCPANTDELTTTMGLNSITEYDCSGFCNNGTRTGTFDWTSNTAKYAVSTKFNGTDNAIQTPSLPTMITDKNYTIAVWIYKTVIGSKGYQTIYGGPSGFEIEARNGSANETKFVPWNWGKPMASYELNEWNHCVFVHSDADCKIYLNGEYIATGTAKASNPTGNYFVGAWNTATQQNFDGLMSDFRIYATALSAEDVKSLYQNCATIDPDGTIRGQIRS